MIGSYTEGDEPVPGFRLIDVLGWGQFGQVWKAAGPGGPEVALKVVNLSEPGTLKEVRNIRRVRQVRHPNLVPIMAFWLKDRHGNLLDEAFLDDVVTADSPAVELIIAMGLGEKTLADRLQECLEVGFNGIPRDELLSYIADVARALDYLNQPIHDLGDGRVAMQHCDIKPHNILLVGGVAQVCDLGVVRVVGDTRQTASMGSAAYIAPEILLDSLPSTNTDQYSLAITYYELRTGRLPMSVKSAARAFLAHLQGKLDFSGLPEPERTVLTRATSVDPTERFTNCVTLAAALRQACSEQRSQPLLQVATKETPAEFGGTVEETATEAASKDPRPKSQADRPTIRVPRLDEEVRKSRPPISEDEFPAFEPAPPPPRKPSPTVPTPRDAAPPVPREPIRPPEPVRAEPAAAPVASATPPRRFTWRLALPPALCAGVMVGSLSAWIARQSPPLATSAPPAEQTAPAVAQPPAASQEGTTPRPPLQPIQIPHLHARTASPFEVLGKTRECNTLREALETAHDGDTILIHGNGPFATEPLEIRGKSLTLRASAGVRPVLVRSPERSSTPWQALLATDRALTLEGLELRDDRAGVLAAPGEPAYLVMTDRAPLHLIGCRLLAPRGAAAVVCRNPGTVELRDCWIVVDQLAVCVELSDALPCELNLTGNSIRTEAPGGAALSLWTVETGCHGALQVILERNSVAAGRLAAWKSLAQGIRVEARHNDFLFREALLSYVAFPGTDGWRRATTWRGSDNRYHGPAEWVQVNGRGAGVKGLTDWRHIFGSPEVGSLSSTALRSR